jgi:hypothetical protein
MRWAEKSLPGRIDPLLEMADVIDMGTPFDQQRRPDYAS